MYTFVECLEQKNPNGQPANELTTIVVYGGYT